MAGNIWRPYAEAHRVKTAEELAQEGDDAQLAMAGGLLRATTPPT